MGYKKKNRQEWRSENGHSRRAVPSTQRRGRFLWEHGNHWPFESKVVARQPKALSVVLNQPLLAAALAVSPLWTLSESWLPSFRNSEPGEERSSGDGAQSVK